MKQNKETARAQELLRTRLGMEGEDYRRVVLGTGEKDAADRLGMSPEAFGRLIGRN